MKGNAVRKEVNVLIPFPVKGRLSDRQIDNRIDRINDLKAQEKALADMRKAVEDELKKYMGDTETLETTKYRISFPKFEKTTFDSKTFRVKHPKLFKAFSVTKEQRSFSIHTI